LELTAIYGSRLSPESSTSSVVMAGLTDLAESKASSTALYVDLPFRRLPAMPTIFTEPGAGAAALAKLGKAATEAAAALRNRRRFMLFIGGFLVRVAEAGTKGKYRLRQEDVPGCMS